MDGTACLKRWVRTSSPLICDLMKRKVSLGRHTRFFALPAVTALGCGTRLTATQQQQKYDCERPLLDYNDAAPWSDPNPTKADQVTPPQMLVTVTIIS
jgi:hypothetical protein